MPRQCKVIALITFALAVLFYFFFQSSKHNVALAQVNAFAEDPFDAVGSFGVQLAVFTALLTLLRAFRPYQLKMALDGQKVLLVRGACFSCLAVAVTLLADVVAMIRYPSLWVVSPAGQMLAALLGGMIILTALVGWFIYRPTRNMIGPEAQSGWIRALVILLGGMLILALYPENWRQSVAGALLTALVGGVLLLVMVWAPGVAILPGMETQFEDVIDDLAAVYGRLKAYSGHFVVFFTFFERVVDSSFVRPVLSWLNPRKHRWNFIILIGVFMGVVLALGEAIGEGGPHQLGRFVIIAAVFVSLEGAGVLLGYAFLAKPLGLFR